MTLSTGTRIGPYEVAAQIGVGGMGEVYRATDTNLKRQVAIKVLPASVAGDTDRLARFQREAEVLASLNHPNIAAIYGLERGAGQTALVMELVEGPTLADRVADGPLPIDEALGIATQIANGLEAAHERGIVHRDLKPANIKVRADGTVKVLDFGLAKAFSEDSGGGGFGPADLTGMPTVTTPAMTQAGMILGTAAYMSPEQAKGRPVDRRADLWAFGCVLYEMLTGRRAFPGEDVAETLASVLRTEPDWSALPAGVPPAVFRVLRGCLAKDARSRRRDAADVRLELSLDDGPPVAPPALTSQRRARWAVAVAAVATVVAAVLVAPAMSHFRERPVQRPPTRFHVATLPGVRPSHVAHSPVLSPDGRFMVFTAQNSEGLGLFLRNMSSGEMRQISGTSSPPLGFTPFWSPDSAAVALVADGGVWRIDVADGRRLPLFDLPDVPRRVDLVDGSWAEDGTILLAYQGRLWRAGQGQSPVELAVGDESGFGLILYPFFLPDGRHFLFGRTRLERRRPGTASLFVGSLDGMTPVLVMDDIRGGAAYADGYILFTRDGIPTAQAFDPVRFTLSGQAMAIGDAADGVISVSAHGQLAYLGSGGTGTTQFTWVDRSGVQLGTVGPPGDYSTFDLSPDGRRVVVSRGPVGRQRLWTIGADDGVLTPLTTGQFSDTDPRWSKNARDIVFASTRAPNRAPHRVTVDGGAPTLVMPWTDGAFSLDDWSQDGALVYHTSGSQSLWAQAPGRDPVLVARLRNGAVDQARISPDGRLVAYNSDESGTVNVYVARMEPNGEQWSVTTSGGVQPVWRPDGKELFFLTPDGSLTSVDVDMSTVFKAGRPKRLFKTPLKGNANIEEFAVDPTGQRFLMSVPTADADGLAPFTVITDWLSLLSR